MLRKTYKVKGEDVDDFMVMQDYAYQSYTSSMVDAFLFQKGYSKYKLNTQKIGLKKQFEKSVQLKNLMFTQHFFLNLELVNTDIEKQKMSFRSRFFNVENELCAMATLQLYWYNNSHEMIISTPRTVAQNFLGYGYVAP
ncbi:hypothetical protein U6A24_13470 [Aquimarina gracilis]|uniref:Uncharacterized protein n=1 Tax=Aquimarina gracilis TaxID=874422 RepID=A0ABU5ZX78_9FLAO|nr:hypothetical protein [Aquimarina gracilis]MEB3346481.1 hypothetical protein [Aquimarina gracilis]